MSRKIKIWVDDLRPVPIGYEGTINNLFYENNQYVFLGIAKEIE